MSNLLDELGLDAEDFEWRDLALCKGMSTEFYFDQYEKDEEIAKAADSVCMNCPVIKQCFFAGSEGQTGVWGGVFWNGSGKPDKNKNDHKTEETWSIIHERVSGE